MTTLTIENIPDGLIAEIQQLAAQQNQSFNEQVLALLKQALQKRRTSEEKYQAVPQVLAEIEQRRKRRRTDVEWLDSTALIREDRER